MFGKNIKKIRSVKGMSQLEFAELFDLKRGTLGAYEEGRSNPKIDTVLKIANYFGINMEDLLINELTVNKLLKFNEAITTTPEINKFNLFDSIPCITESLKKNFIQKYRDTFNIDHYPQIQLPYITRKDTIGYVVDNLEMSDNSSGYLPKDIVIGVKTKLTDLKNTTSNLVLVLTKNQLLFRKLSFDSDKIILKAEHIGIDPVSIVSSDIIAVWKIIHAFHYTIPQQRNLTEQRLADLEEKIASLKSNL